MRPKKPASRKNNVIRKLWIQKNTPDNTGEFWVSLMIQKYCEPGM